MPRRMLKRLKLEYTLQTGSCCRQAENTHVELRQHGASFAAFSYMPHNLSVQLLMDCAPASTPLHCAASPCTDASSEVVTQAARQMGFIGPDQTSTSPNRSSFFCLLAAVHGPYGVFLCSLMLDNKERKALLTS